MALTSQLFRGNKALEACEVKDPAHITIGATGDHVAKIQFALFTLDRLVIDRKELVAQLYGKSTAAAVLAYKKRRKIINPSYQSAADNIVGKMTIASLDKDMQVRERVPKPPGDCSLTPSRPSNAFGVVAAPSAVAGSSSVTAPPVKPPLSGFIRVVFATTLISSTQDGYPLSASIEFARDTLSAVGIALSVEIRNGFADTIPFPSRVLSSPGAAGDNVDEIRKAFEDLRPGLPGVLRVIVCQMVSDGAGDTFRNRNIGGRIVPPFILLNSQIIDQGRATLIHEMIHVSKPGVVPHDPEEASIFFKHGSEKPGGVARTFLKPEHALTLRTMASKL